MASTVKQRLRRFNGTDYDTIHLETQESQIIADYAKYAPSKHGIGDIFYEGASGIREWPIMRTISENGFYLVWVDTGTGSYDNDAYASGIGRGRHVCYKAVTQAGECIITIDPGQECEATCYMTTSGTFTSKWIFRNGPSFSGHDDSAKLNEYMIGRYMRGGERADMYRKRLPTTDVPANGTSTINITGDDTYCYVHCIKAWTITNSNVCLPCLAYMGDPTKQILISTQLNTVYIVNQTDVLQRCIIVVDYTK